MELKFKDRVNQRIFDVPDYDQGHVTECWKNPEIVRAMSNESNYAPAEFVQKAIQEAASKANFYAEDPSYALSLREKLAAYGSVKAENVTLGNGSIELLDLLFQIFVNEPGKDEAILLQPDYSAYAPRLTFFGGVIKYAVVGTTFENVADKVIEQINDNTKFVLFSRPNNPVGPVIGREEVLRILDTGVFVICDEAYIEMADEGTTMSPMINEYDNLIVLRTFSKGFGLAGIRFGYMMANQEIIRYVNRARHIFNVNLAAMMAAEASMDHLDEVKAFFKKLAVTRDWLSAELAKLPGLKPIPSQGNFVMINVEETGKTGTDFCDFLYSKGFFVRDFSKKAGLKPGAQFRISVGTREQMQTLIDDLTAFLK
jgi:histidinol-phosphate aminotransferase